MTSTEIAVRPQHDTDSWVQMLPAVGELAEAVNRTDFVPGPLRGHAPAVAAAILAGREIGLPPLMSLQHIHIIDGRPTLSAQMQRSLALAAGYHLRVVETNTTRCIVEGRRSAADEWTRVTWTLDDAKKAGLLGRQNWQKHPRRMLQARATGELCQLVFSDAIAGMAATEEAEDDAEGPGAVLVNGSEKPAQRTAQRRQRIPERPTGAAPAAATEPTTVPAPEATAPSGLPPLPGEDEPEPSPPFDPDEHGTATRGKGGQLTALWTVLSDVFAFTQAEKDQARGICEHIIGRDLPGTTGDMSWNEAKTVLDTLANWQKIAESRNQHPRDTLIAILAESGKASTEEAGDGQP